MCLFLLLIMTITWGELPKSGIDAETIEEAIVRICSAHNDDPMAHMEPGQSVYEHRKEEILDHPVGSVLADKTSISEFDYKTLFENLDAFSSKGGTVGENWPGVNLEVEDGAVETSYVGLNFLGILGGDVKSKDFLLEAQVSADTVGNTWQFWAGINSNALIAPDDFGIRAVGGQLRGFARYNGSYHETGDLGALTATPRLLRAQYIAAEEVIYFYIDGAYAAQLNVTGTFSVGNHVYLRAEANGEESGLIRVYSARFSIAK